MRKWKRKIERGGIKFKFGNTISSEYPFNTVEHQNIIFRRTVEDMLNSSSPPSEETLNSTIEYLNSNLSTREKLEYFKTIVPKLDLDTSVIIRSLSDFMPDYVESVKKESTINLIVEAVPNKRLLEIDIINNLKHISNLLNVFSKEQDSKITGNKLKLVVNELAYDEREIRETTETKRIPWHEVDMMKAVMLMPKNATYMYDVVSGGTEIRYAYEISVYDSNGKVFNKLLRDNVSSHYTRCGNKRIQNVFGGVKAANFDANSQMQADCAKGGYRISLNELQKQVLDNLIVIIQGVF